MLIKSVTPRNLKLKSIKSLLFRSISIKSYPVKDSQNKTRSIILKTCQDFDPSNEEPVTYHRRSVNQITNELLHYTQTSSFMMIKINQSVIDYRDWRMRGIVTPKVLGHTWCGLFDVSSSDKSLTPVKGSLLSKVFNNRGIFYENDTTILSTQFITPKKQNKLSVYGSGEFYWFIDPTCLNFDCASYVTKVNSLIIENETYSLSQSACGQAVFKAWTGKNLETNKSAQTATVRAVLESVNRRDVTFFDNLRTQIQKSQLSLEADEIDYVNLNSPDKLLF